MSPKLKPQPSPRRHRARHAPVAVHYDVRSGPGAGHAFGPDGQLAGVGVARDGEPSRYGSRNIAEFVESLGDAPRIYHDARLARLVELRAGLTQAESWDDIRAMAVLLGNSPADDLEGLARHMLDNDDQFESEYGAHRSLAAGCKLSAETILRLYYDADLPQQIHEVGLDFVYQLEQDVADVTVGMIKNGVGVNAEHLAQFAQKHRRIADKLRRQIRQVAGKTFNPNAAAQIVELLYDELELPVIETTNNGNPAQDQETLRRLQAYDATGVVKQLRRYQRHIILECEATKLLRSVAPQTWRIHANLDPLGACTGRFGCSEPNLQSVPEALLGAFVAAEGHLFVEADFNQIELRGLAHFTRDPELRKAFCGPGVNVDLHRRTAAEALGIAMGDVSDRQRNGIGKEINFGVIYGQTGRGLAEKLGSSRAEAQGFIRRYFDRHPRIEKWIHRTEFDAQDDGCVRTLYGRRRLFSDSENWDSDWRVSKNLRQAVNHVIQGTAADIFKLALVRLAGALPADCRMLMAVHDSILVEVPCDQVKQVMRVIREALEEPPPGFKVPLVVKIRQGHTWAECKAK